MAGSNRRRQRTGGARHFAPGALSAAMVLLVGSLVSADGHLPTESEAATQPPPGTLSTEGMVPAQGAAEGDAGSPALEPIGHVPGPGEGVYGDPPNTGGTIDPEKRGWAYDTDYFFMLTRSLEHDTDLSKSGRRWVSPWTLTMDLVTLPTAALAGLSGRAPAPETPKRSE